MNRLRLIFTGFLLLVALANSPVVAQEVICSTGQMRINGVCGNDALSSLTPGWNQIEPGGDTTCAHDTPYSYWVRPGTRNDLLVYMEGGGGCWNAATCRDTGEEFNGFYDSRITPNDNPALRSGVLDLDNADNPFKDYTIVYVPVCTGDVHWGNNIHTYDNDVTIHFNGFVNAQSALQWAYDNLSQPDSVFVTGCSAGSAGSILHAPYIIQQYSDTPVYQFGDSLSLLFTGSVDLQTDWHTHDNFPEWIPELAGMKPEEWTMAKMYSAIANAYPTYTFSQFNTVRDRVQVFYTYPDGSGSPDDWARLMDSHLETLAQTAPNYRAFTAGGNLHCITPRPDFYRYAIDGVQLRDWVADMAAGKPVESLHCKECEQAEVAG